MHSTDNVYIADMYNNRIRKVVKSTGIITQVAGSSTTGNFSGDGAAATSSTLYYPTGVAVDSSGNDIVYYAFSNYLLLLQL